jgi:chromosome segregation ATPase
VGFTSEDARQYQFSGTRHSYAAAEVEDFRNRVIETLLDYEVGAKHAAAPTAGSQETDLAAAQRVRQQAVQLAERMLREVMGSSGDAAAGIQIWQDAAMNRALADEELAFAREESNRLNGIAAARSDELRATYDRERTQLRAELHKELQSSRAAADDEAARIRTAARAEAAAILEKALGEVEQSRIDASEELQRMERRLAVLRTALADAEGRFRRLAATAANEVGTLSAIADQDVAPSPIGTPPPAVTHVDLTDEALREMGGESVPSEPFEQGLPGRNPEVGFYQRRLAGLRDRLEKSGHPPE